MLPVAFLLKAYYLSLLLLFLYFKHRMLCFNSQTIQHYFNSNIDDFSFLFPKDIVVDRPTSNR